MIKQGEEELFAQEVGSFIGALTVLANGYNVDVVLSALINMIGYTITQSNSKETLEIDLEEILEKIEQTVDDAIEQGHLGRFIRGPKPSSRHMN